MGVGEAEGGEDGVEERDVEGCALLFDFEDGAGGGVEGGAEAGHVGCVANVAAG